MLSTNGPRTVKALLGVASLLLLLGCVNPRVRLSAFNDSWVGGPLDEFVRANGRPVGEYVMSDGSTVLIFIFGHDSIRMPPSTAVTSFSGGVVTGTILRGGSSQLGCVLEVWADPQRRIARIEIEHDTMGMRTTSRCHEVLPKQ